MKRFRVQIPFQHCTAILFAAILSGSQARAQVSWSDPIQITTGEGNDFHPSFINNFYDGQAGLVFTRADSQEQSICLVRRSLNNVWTDSVIYIITDTVQLGLPTASARSSSSNIVVVWQECRKTCNLRFAFVSQNSIRGPFSLTEDSLDNTRPYLSPSPESIGLTWIRGGRVAYSELEDTVWTEPEVLSGSTDTVVFQPSLNSVLEDPFFAPFVVWGSPSGVSYAIKMSSGWYVGHLEYPGAKHPRIVKNSYQALVTFDSVNNDGGDIFVAEVYPFSNITRILESPNIDDQNASFAATRIITSPGRPSGIMIAGAWQSGLSQDSIAVIDLTQMSPLYLQTTSSAQNRNPDISSDHPEIYWSAWESNASGRWKIHGSFAAIPMIAEESLVPSVTPILGQNYPNPFNPSTNIKFQIPSSNFVSLEVYNVLGQKVRTLVNEKREAGEHSVAFDATGLPSGVYVYRLRAGEFSQSRKMILVR